MDLLPAPKQGQVDSGDGVHEASCGRESIVRGGRDVLEGGTLVSKGFEVEAEIEMSVELGIELNTRGPENLFRIQFTAEHLVDLEHRYAGVGADREQGTPGLLGRFGAGNAEKMPGGVLDVVRIHRAVGFELARQSR